jgi:virulence factor Mce-like protein
MTALAARLRSRVLAWTALLVAGALALTGCGTVYDLPLPGGASVGSNPITVHVIFRDVLDLVPQSTVKVDDITVGKVTAIKLQGYHADVTIELRRGLDLPDNTRAEIRQTSLLGEKFVSLSAPPDPVGRLASGDVIGLDHTGRNPEVEEVLGALALLLNGGGVGQLKTIASELNSAAGGRESDIRSVLTQLHTFMGQLDHNKAAIVTAIDNVNRLAAGLRQQDGTIKQTLDDVPAALKSLNGQRADLVRMLGALQRLSGVGVRVIRASKASTIDSLRELAPVLTAFAKAGQDMPDALQVFLTYPFVDAAVGNNPQVARNLHMGDYTNLSARLDLDLGNLTLPGLPGLPGLPKVPLPTVTVPGPVVNACKQVRRQVEQAAAKVVDALPDQLYSAKQKKAIKKAVVDKVMGSIDCAHPGNIPKLVAAALTYVLSHGISGILPKQTPQQIQQALDQVSKTVGGALGGAVGGLLGGSSGGSGGGSGTGGGGGGGLLGLGRPALDAYRLPAPADPYGLAGHGIDPSLGTLLLQGVAS